MIRPGHLDLPIIGAAKSGWNLDQLRARAAGEAMKLIAGRHPGDGMMPYERLLGDALRGDASLFTSGDCVEAA